MRVLAVPFDIAADGIGQRGTDCFASQCFAEYLLEIVDGDVFWHPWAIHGAAGVDQLTVAIEDEEVQVRRAP